ncbi:MAG: hypothetical protein ACRD5L_16270 [Bryobacteraceae bacterium]
MVPAIRFVQQSQDGSSIDQALAPMATPQTLPHGLPYSFRPSSVATRESSEAFRCDLMKLSLPLIVVIINIALFQPLLCGQIENGGQRHFATAGLALQICLQLGGNTPAVHFRPHALQCSASL